MKNTKLTNSFLFGENGIFIEELYQKYLINPASVEKEWQDFFADLGDNSDNISSYLKRASWAPKKNQVIGISLNNEPVVKKSKDEVAITTDFQLNTKLLIEEYRLYGHLLASLDPLNLEIRNTEKEIRLDPESWGFSKNDFDRKISVSDFNFGVAEITVTELISKLKQIYCDKIGFEFAHISSIQERDWLYSKAETITNQYLSPENLKKMLQDLVEIEGFEQFIHNKFPGAKRFSIEGGEASIIALGEIIRVAGEEGQVEEVVLGMAHRGRLNVLTKIMAKGYEALLSEFQGNIAHTEDLDISGDVKYHLGKSADITLDNGKKIHLSLTANPSHLEAVNSVVQGRVRAKQDLINDLQRNKILGILIHGDAAFAGQGVVAESLSIGDIDAYETGGTIHIVINNQVGFTTLPKDARKSRYPTEFAKIIQAPVIHVNGDDPISVIKVAALAEQYRQKFKKDIIIDVVCYRRYGHNEGDEPMFTQPIMYHKIKNHPTITQIFYKQLLDLKIIDQNFFDTKVKLFQEKLENDFNLSKTYKPSKADWLDGLWSGMKRYEKNNNYIEKTAISEEKIQKYGKILTEIPQKFNLNSKLKRLFESKKQMFATGKDFDWATAESLAFASLIDEGKKIRISGQDSKRGTFSHRHAVIFDQETQQEYVPLNQLENNKKGFEVHNSNLSEFAVLGFEYGYSVVDPNCLTIWEAQFGDFANGAQIIIDQFISSAENKWLRMSGLVMLLPHGYEGQGPEHSSARLERFLQLCAEDNMQVVNCTTPANYFHALRRQLIDRDFRKPLIVMSPKSLLRHKLVISDLAEMSGNSTFNKIYDEQILDKKDIERVVICSGKLYYDLLENREQQNIKNTALIRMEQYYPFPKYELEKILSNYNKNCKFIWCQEEPKNMGAWKFICHDMDDVLESINAKYPRIIYAGRNKSSSPAVGYLKIHAKEQHNLINDAFSK